MYSNRLQYSHKVAHGTHAGKQHATIENIAARKKDRVKRPCRLPNATKDPVKVTPPIYFPKKRAALVISPEKVSALLSQNENRSQ